MAVADQVRDIVAPLLEQRGLELYDLEHGGGVLRVVVDRDGGVDLELLSDATRAVSRALDELDPIGGRYTLEVTSPGLERALRTPQHFARAVGSTVKVRTVPGVEGERRITGVLVSSDADRVVIRSNDDAAEHELRFDEIERARTVFEWGPAEKKRAAKS